MHQLILVLWVVIVANVCLSIPPFETSSSTSIVNKVTEADQRDVETLDSRIVENDFDFTDAGITVGSLNAQKSLGHRDKNIRANKTESIRPTVKATEQLKGEWAHRSTQSEHDVFGQAAGVHKTTEMIWDMTDLVPEDAQGDEGDVDFPVTNTTSSQNGSLGDSSHFGDVVSGSLRITPVMGQPPTSFHGFVSKCSGMGKRLCGCLSSCSVINNCCFDVNFIDKVIESSPNDFRKYSCYSDINDKWMLYPPSRLVNQCSKSWTNETLRNQCEHPNEDEMYSYIPFYSPTTGLSYRNVFCLRCNGLSDEMPWVVTFQSVMPFPFHDFKSFADLTAIAGVPLDRRGRKFVMSPQNSFEPSHCSFALKQCKPEFTTDMLSRMCQAFHNPVQIGKELYRNTYCFQCITGNSPEDTLLRDISRGHQTSMSLLLNIRTGQEELDCSRSDCVPTISRVRGYYEEFPVSLVITPLANITGLDRLAILELNQRCTDIIKTFMKKNLSQYTHVTEILINKGYEFQHKRNVIITLHITDDIPVADIATIDKVVRDIHYEVNLDDVVRVSCCQDKDDHPPEERGSSTGAPCQEIRCNGTMANVTSSAEGPQPISHLDRITFISVVIYMTKLV